MPTKERSPSTRARLYAWSTRAEMDYQATTGRIERDMVLIGMLLLVVAVSTIILVYIWR